VHGQEHRADRQRLERGGAERAKDEALFDGPRCPSAEVAQH
jgi:hypothetical protein